MIIVLIQETAIKKERLNEELKTDKELHKLKLTVITGNWTDNVKIY